MNDDDVQVCFHGPEIIPNEKSPATIHNRQLLCILLNSGSSCCLIKQSYLTQGVSLKDLSVTKTIKTKRVAAALRRIRASCGPCRITAARADCHDERDMHQAAAHPFVPLLFLHDSYPSLRGSGPPHASDCTKGDVKSVGQRGASPLCVVSARVLRGWRYDSA